MSRWPAHDLAWMADRPEFWGPGDPGAVEAAKRKKMDPNANWEEAVQIADNLRRQSGLFYPEVAAREGERLAELVLALNDWMAKGGFPPKVFTEKK